MAHDKVRCDVVLVDIDGTLIDSNDAHARAWMAALKRHGHEFPFDVVRPLIGKGGDKLLEELLGLTPESEEARAISEDRSHVFQATELHKLVPTAGARELLLKIKDAGLKVVVATSAQPTETAMILRQAGLEDLVDHEANAGDAAASKPDPDIVQHALEKAGARPSAVIMLGDTPYDIEAARKAGVWTIVLRCGGWWNDSAFKGALGIYDTPRALADAIDFKSSGGH